MNTLQTTQVSLYLHTINDFERIGDHAVNICDYTKLIEEKHIVFSDDAKQQMEEMKMICEKMFHNISKIPEDTQEWLQKFMIQRTLSIRRQKNSTKSLGTYQQRRM